MGLKTDSHPTNSRSAKLSPRDLKIKQIVETTRCTHSEAEEALQENNNELESAVSWILDHNGDNVWTEPKGRKTKKTEPVVEEPQRPPRGESSNRRGGRRGGGTTRGGANNVNWKPGQVFTRTEPPSSVTNSSNAPTSLNNTVPTSGDTGASTLVNSSATATSAINSSTPASTLAKPTPVMKTAAGPMSFAAVCAKKLPPPQTTTVPSSSEAPKPTSPAPSPLKPVQSPQATTHSATKEPSPAPQETIIKPTPSVSKPEPVSPEVSSERFTEDSNTAQSLTSQLKNDLGLGSTPTKNIPSPSNMISTSASPANIVPTRGTVEFVSDLNTNKSYNYHFGFNPESSVPMEESSFKSSNNAGAQNDYRSHENDVYKSSNVESSSPASKSLASAVTQLSNYGIQPQQQQAAPSQQQQQTAPSQQQPRRSAFGYAETSTVSYPPPESRSAVNSTPAAPATSTPALSSYTKPAVTAQSSYNHSQQQQPPQVQQQQPPLHQHTSQQQMYNPMYGGYPYVNLYSPVAGRAEDSPYGPYHMPYAAYGMDVNSLAQMMPHMTPMQAAVPNHHQQQQTAHRTDHHQNFNDMKQTYGQSAAANPNASAVNASGQRDANMTTSNVPPPPGFSGPPANHMYPPNQHLPSMYPFPMFMPQKMPGQIYGGHQNDDSMEARHQTQAKMYGQQDKYSNGSNVRDRMAAMGTAQVQPTPPPTQATYGQQPSYAGNGQMNSVLNTKKQPYHGGQWNN
jgi:hypothetical protein